ncbi:MAG: radical SAM protein [Nanoarchaeota archaeon]|nr:radical SAM protein [Nanoarchaeota archaeon]MBU1030481.1 radical SAM protein [Nanoarchaeota archaeon]
MLFEKNTFPKYMTLDISSTCNLNCIICSLKKYYKNKSIMPEQVFKEITPIIPKLDYIDLNCNAEPLMNKNLLSYLKQIKSISPKTKVGFPTNGTLLNERIIKELILNDLDIIRFSIDGSTKETFESIRKTADFDKLIHNIKLFNQLKKKFHRNNPQITIVFLAMKKNVKELPLIIDLAEKLKISEVAVLGLEPYSKLMSKEILYGNSESKKFFDLAMKKALSKNIHLQLPVLNSYMNQSCIFKDMFFITVEGDVVPCPLLSYDREFYYFGKKFLHKKKIFGNILNKNLESIWNSKKYKHFRKLLSKKKFPKSCKHCLMKEGLIVPFDESI